MPFATHDDVQQRLGRPLTTAEEETADATIVIVTGLIADCAGRDADWAKDLDPVPEALKAICVSKAASVILNPGNLASESESLGAYSHSQTQNRSDDVGVFLSPFEERQVSRAVYGRTSASSTPRTLLDRAIDLREGRDPDEPLPAA